MTDSKTSTELRIMRVLKERGLSQAKLARMCDVNESSMSRIVRGIEPPYPNRGQRIADALDWQGNWQELFVDVDTPEHAIAATLGSGTVTAEQVRAAIFEHSAYANYDGAQYYASGIRMQAIADELNAELESGTCEWLLEHSGTLYDKWRCSKCGYLHVESRTDGGATDLDPNYCPNCGKKVEL